MSFIGPCYCPNIETYYLSVFAIVLVLEHVLYWLLLLTYIGTPSFLLVPVIVLMSTPSLSVHDIIVLKLKHFHLSITCIVLLLKLFNKSRILKQLLKHFFINPCNCPYITTTSLSVPEIILILEQLLYQSLYLS